MDISYQADFLHWCVGRRHRVWSDRRPVSKHQLWSSRIDFYVFPPNFCSLSPCSIGRRKTLMAAVLLWNVSGFALCWAPEYISFIILEFIVAAAQHGAFMVCNVMGKPLLRPCVRLVLSVCLSVCQCAGFYLCVVRLLHLPLVPGFLSFHSPCWPGIIKQLKQTTFNCRCSETWFTTAYDWLPFVKSNKPCFFTYSNRSIKSTT